MSFLGRIKDLLSANINALLDGAEDPEKMANEYLRQLNDQFYQAKTEVASSMADENRLQQKMIQYGNEVDKWQAQAGNALRAGKEDLAKSALLRKQQSQRIYAQYEQQFHAQSEQVDLLQEGLASLETRIAETKAKRDLIIAKKNRAKTQEALQQTVRSLGRVSAMDKLDMLEERVDDRLAKAEAMTELETDTLDNQFRKLEQETGVDAELEEMKRNMGLS
jgi:phage shock protein A